MARAWRSLGSLGFDFGVDIAGAYTFGAGPATERQTGWQPQPLPLVALIRAVRLVMPSPKVGIVNR
jgi:hypothetical protein